MPRDTRTIAIGYYTDEGNSWYQKPGDHPACGGNKSQAIEFDVVNAVSWCGDSSYTGYSLMVSDLEV